MIQWFNSFVYMWRKLKDSFEQINTLLAFIVALFAICKIQKKLKCVSTHKWIKVMWYQFIQLFNLVRLFATPRTATHQVSLSFTIVSVAIQPSHPLSPPSPLALNLSQLQGFFQWVSSSHQVAKVLEFQLQHQSFQWTPRTDFL